MKRHTVLWWLPAIAVMVLIFYFSQMNGDASASISGFGAERIIDFLKTTGLLTEKAEHLLAQNMEYLLRKTAHASEYALLGACFVLPMAFHLRKRGKKLILFSIIPAVIYACSDEFHQLFINGRAARLSDVGIDSAGVCVGVLLMTLILRGQLKRADRSAD